MSLYKRTNTFLKHVLNEFVGIKMNDSKDHFWIIRNISFLWKAIWDGQKLFFKVPLISLGIMILMFIFAKYLPSPEGLAVASFMGLISLLYATFVSPEFYNPGKFMTGKILVIKNLLLQQNFYSLGETLLFKTNLERRFKALNSRLLKLQWTVLSLWAFFLYQIGMLIKVILQKGEFEPSDSFLTLLLIDFFMFIYMHMFFSYKAYIHNIEQAINYAFDEIEYDFYILESHK